MVIILITRFQSLPQYILKIFKLHSLLGGDTMQLKRGHSLIEGIALLVLLGLIVELMSKL
jgi:hypothetical protein